MSLKTYLITGANTGLGLDTTRQLAIRDDVGKVFLACRSKAKAEKAIASLVSNHDINAEKLAFVPFDASASKVEIESAVNASLPKGTKLDGIVLNAGGIGADTQGKPTEPNNILPILQINLAAHVHLIDFLLAQGYFIKNKSHVIFSGTEGSRGISMMGMKSPEFTGTTPEYFKTYMDGSAYAGKKYDAMDKPYPDAKGIATFYMAAWARAHPEVTVYVVSPGGTKGTSFSTQEALPYIARFIVPVMMTIMTWLGKFHDLELGAKRYVDAVTGEGAFKDNAFASGSYIASKEGVVGPLADQTLVFDTAKQYGDIKKQDAVFSAMNQYL